MIVQIKYKYDICDRLFYCEGFDENLTAYTFREVQSVNWDCKSGTYVAVENTDPSTLVIYIDSIIEIEMSK